MSATVGAQTTTVTRVATSTSSATIANAQSGRRGYIIVNDSAVVLYVLFGTGSASATNYSVQLAAGATYEHVYGTAAYAGPIQAITASSTGNAQVTIW